MNSRRSLRKSSFFGYVSANTYSYPENRGEIDRRVVKFLSHLELIS